MNISSLESEAKFKALKNVAALLSTPEKLEKLNEINGHFERKKSSVESMLKAALQSQLDGVKRAMQTLDSTLSQMKVVQQSVYEIENGIEDVPTLVESVNEVERETSRHSQLSVAIDNMQHIFTIPESVRSTKQLIMMESSASESTSSNMLLAHKNLMELESSRDGLLKEIEKMKTRRTISTGSTFASDKKLIIDYFSPVADLSNFMRKHIESTLRRTLNVVRNDPKIIVTALRIIEREEKLDEIFVESNNTSMMMSSVSSSTSMTHFRPKGWRNKALEVLRKSVRERIEGNFLETDRTEGKMWLVRHLELVRLSTIEDLRVVKTLCQPVFPPHYQIYDHYTLLYHEALSNRMLEIASSGLEDQEFVTFLSWVVKTYCSAEFMGHISLAIPKSKIRPLLDPTTLQDIEQQYLQNMELNYIKWMDGTLTHASEEWRGDGTSGADHDSNNQVDVLEVDSDSCYFTSTPIIVFQMFDENLQVAKSISKEMTRGVLHLSLSTLHSHFVGAFKSAIGSYTSTYFRDRRCVARFTNFMSALANDSSTFIQLTIDLLNRWKVEFSTGEEWTKLVESINDSFMNIMSDCGSYLIDEAFLDLSSHLTDHILTPSWMSFHSGTSPAIDTVCATLEDYVTDFNFLKKHTYDGVMKGISIRLCALYATSMLSSSMNPLLSSSLVFSNMSSSSPVGGVTGAASNMTTDGNNTISTNVSSTEISNNNTSMSNAMSRIRGAAVASSSKGVFFQNPEDRRTAAEKVCAEARQLYEFFAEFGGENFQQSNKDIEVDVEGEINKIDGDDDTELENNHGNNTFFKTQISPNKKRTYVSDQLLPQPFQTLVEMGEVLKADKELLSLDLATLSHNHKGYVTRDHLVALLSVRGDLSKTEARDLASSFVSTSTIAPSSLIWPTNSTSIFSAVSVLGIGGGILKPFKSGVGGGNNNTVTNLTSQTMGNSLLSGLSRAAVKLELMSQAT